MKARLLLGLLIGAAALAQEPAAVKTIPSEVQIAGMKLVIQIQAKQARVNAIVEEHRLLQSELRALRAGLAVEDGKARSECERCSVNWMAGTLTPPEAAPDGSTPGSPIPVVPQ